MTFFFPGTITVVPPAVPRIAMGPPPGTGVVTVLPVTGPRGEKGDKGDAGDSTEVLGYEHTQSSPAVLVQIHHNLPYKPAGVYCRESSSGDQIGPASVTHPFAGISEVAFGFPFTGQILLS